MPNKEDVIALLIKSGWYEGRKVNRALLVQLLRSNGYEVSDKVLDFLESYEGIVIHFYNPMNGFENDDITVSVEQGNELLTSDAVVEEYEPRVGSKLCVIGTAYRNYMALLMDDAGRVFAEFDGFLIKLGNSWLDAVEAVINGRKFEEIPK